LNGPDPSTRHPMGGFPQVCFIKNTVTNPNIVIGDYTYYDDPEDPENFQRNVLYHYPFIGDRLVIGKFCALARGVKFIMNGANHKLSGISTYPFQIFGGGWEKVMPRPGVRIGNGAIISSRFVVTGEVAPYTIVGVNPAKAIKQRFSPEVVATLESIAWWDWPIERISRCLEIIVAADVEALKKAAGE
jgi:virginiamycin A acetyltransferase